MTTYTFIANPSTTSVNWNDPTVWQGGVVPNSPDADVVIPTITSGGSPYDSIITISNAQTYSVDSVSLSSNALFVAGTLSVAADFDNAAGGLINMEGGSLSAGSLENSGEDIRGSGQISVTGTVTNAQSIFGSGLTLTVAALNNSGNLEAASGNLTVNVTSGGFANLSGSTLNGGSYSAGFLGNQSANVLDLNIGGTIAVDAATIALSGGGQIACFDSGSGMFVPIQSTLNTIAQNGTLSLAQQTYNWGSLTDNGALLLADGTVLDASQLTVSSTGKLSGSGTVGSPVVNNGLIEGGLPLGPPFNSTDPDYLTITGDITGNGSLEIAPSYYNPSSLKHVGATLELGGSDSQNVTFPDVLGTLVLDDPAGFSGTIASPSGGRIVLPGISIGSVTGYQYSGNQNGGTLTINEGGSTIALAFSGNFDPREFHLSAGPQQLSSSPPSLLVTVGGPLLSLSPAAAYTAGAGATALSSAATATDISAPLLAGVTVTIAGGTFANDGDVLTAATAGTNITAVYNATTETLVLSGVTLHSSGDSLANFQQVLDSVSFSSSSTDPTNGQQDPVRTLNWTATDTNNVTTTVTTTLQIFAPNPSLPTGTTADLIIQDGGSGNYQIFDLGKSGILGGYPLGQVGPNWQPLGLGDFTGNDTSDILVRDTNTGSFHFFDVSNNQMTDGGASGGIGGEWQLIGFGQFSGNPNETDMVMRDSNTGAIDYFDIRHNQIVAGGSAGGIGTEWQTLGVGDFSGNSGETDLIMRDANTGVLDYFDVQNNKIVGSGSMGGIGTNWQALGVGDFSGNAGETDLIMRDTNTGALDYFDIAHNQITASGAIGGLGMEWQVLGFGNFGASPGEVDMLIRNTNNGSLQYFGIQHNQIVASGAIGSIGTEWNAVGLVNVPGFVS